MHRNGKRGGGGAGAGGGDCVEMPEIIMVETRRGQLN